MYTIFNNDVPIYLTDSLKNKSELFFFRYDKDTINVIFNKVKSGEVDKVFLYHSDINELWENFKNNFKIEKAAGGLVKNEKDETLFILRFRKWDLPKGKIEKGESKKEAAVREVKEECGLPEVKIINKLQNTYHIFERDGKEILKITYWYLMETNYKGNLIPQIEEDITDVVFKDRQATKLALQNTYGNIKTMFIF